MADSARPVAICERCGMKSLLPVDIAVGGALVAQGDVVTDCWFCGGRAVVPVGVYGAARTGMKLLAAGLVDETTARSLIGAFRAGLESHDRQVFDQAVDQLPPAWQVMVKRWVVDNPGNWQFIAATLIALLGLWLGWRSLRATVDVDDADIERIADRVVAEQRSPSPEAVEQLVERLLAEERPRRRNADSNPDADGAQPGQSAPLDRSERRGGQHRE